MSRIVDPSSNDLKMSAPEESLWSLLRQQGYERAIGRPWTREEKLEMIKSLVRLHGSVEEAISRVRGDNIQIDPRLSHLGARCPEPDIPCKSFEFGNIKVFYHPDEWPLFPRGSWSFYIARPGSDTTQCIHWAAEDISIFALGPSNRWDYCCILTVPSGTRIRIDYPYLKSRHVQELVFPMQAVAMTPGIPVAVLP